MNKYEAMLIIKPDLPESERQELFSYINEAVTKNSGKVAQAVVWSEKRKLTFTIKRQQEGVYYLVNFDADPKAVKEIDRAYKLNENILRALITNPQQ